MLKLPEMTLTRVGYLDVPVPPGFLGLGDPGAIPWRNPWATDDAVLVGAAAWFAEIGDRRIVFDPFLALDVVLRADPGQEAQHQAAIMAACEAAGFAVDTIDTVLLSHIEGIGMLAHHDEHGDWSPFFPNARITLNANNLKSFQDNIEEVGPERTPWEALFVADVVDTFENGDTLAPGIRAASGDGHGIGHTVFELGDPVAAYFIGHVAVSPLHLVSGECAAVNEDPALAWKISQSLLESVSSDQYLIGPLWPAPGMGHWDGERIAVAQNA